jgi:4,5-DOPA dioxygenase extradiol
MPVAFVGHGAPTLATDPSKGAELREWFAGMFERYGRPQAILVISAHWQATPATIGATSTVPLIDDFYGFPPAISAIEYPAPGAPELAERVAELLGGAPRRKPNRGLDHGAWIPLLHLVPEADIPVLQISLPSGLHPPELIAFGRALAVLRDEGVLLLGSGNVVHDLDAVDPSQNAPTPEWARAIDEWTATTLAARDLAKLEQFRGEAPLFEEHHPTEEHWQPLLIIAGAGLGVDGQAGEVTFPITGFEWGSISRRCVEIG